MKYILTKEDKMDKYLKLSDLLIFLTDYLHVFKKKQGLKDT